MNNYLKTYSESHNFTQSYETLKLRNYAHQNEIQFKIFRVAINDTSSLCGVHKLLIAPTTISSVSCGIIMVHIVYIYICNLFTVTMVKTVEVLKEQEKEMDQGQG